MKRLLKIIGIVAASLVVLVLGFYVWASVAAGRKLGRTIETHAVEFPTPFPVDTQDIEAANGSEESRRQYALERALERGRHLVEARYACNECHGHDFSGGVMIDAPILGRLFGPNLTAGAGGKTAGYNAADWDRIVRHGILPDGRPAVMPSEDFQRMTDQELSDIIVYIRSQPPVDNEVPAPTFGPLGKVLLATGQLPLSADIIGSHDTPHAAYPPPTAVTVEFGRHLSGICTGCHGQDFSGGPIPGGDPSWVPARNLTPHQTGLRDWSYQDFVSAMRAGERPDGSPVREPMTLLMPYAQRMTDTELEALWVFLRSLPPVASAQ